MKTKKYSSSMKAVMALAMMFLISGIAFSQTIEERKGASTTYSVAPGAGTDEYTWTIEADVAPASVTPAFSSGTGTVADPGVISYADGLNLTSIDVTWAADGSPDTISSSAVITVQKRIDVGGGNYCESAEQAMNISFWSDPSAAIITADQNTCSAALLVGSITIDLTGAPDDGQSGFDGFTVVYDVEFSDPALTGTGSNSTAGTGFSVTSDQSTVTIPLPDDLTNTDSAPQEYRIRLQSVQDDFNDGPYAVAGEVYTITVYPIPTTGTISSLPVPLNRR